MSSLAPVSDANVLKLIELASMKSSQLFSTIFEDHWDVVSHATIKASCKVAKLLLASIGIQHRLDQDCFGESYRRHSTSHQTRLCRGSREPRHRQHSTWNHKPLTNRLESEFRVAGTSLQWISSYLQERSFMMRVSSSRSTKVHQLGFFSDRSSFSFIYDLCITDWSLDGKYDMEYHIYDSHVTHRGVTMPKKSREMCGSNPRLVHFETATT